jgi:hypothetical protein
MDGRQRMDVIQAWIRSHWRMVTLLGLGLFLASTALSRFLVTTKVSFFVGAPLHFYGEGLLPTSGSLELGSVWRVPQLLFDLVFWLTVAGLFMIKSRLFRAGLVAILALPVALLAYSRSGESEFQGGISEYDHCTTHEGCMLFTLEYNGSSTRRCATRQLFEELQQSPDRVVREEAGAACQCIENVCAMP